MNNSDLCSTLHKLFSRRVENTNGMVALLPIGSKLMAEAKGGHINVAESTSLLQQSRLDVGKGTVLELTKAKINANVYVDNKEYTLLDRAINEELAIKFSLDNYKLMLSSLIETRLEKFWNSNFNIDIEDRLVIYTGGGYSFCKIGILQEKWRNSSELRVLKDDEYGSSVATTPSNVLTRIRHRNNLTVEHLTNLVLETLHTNNRPL